MNQTDWLPGILMLLLGLLGGGGFIVFLMRKKGPASAQAGSADEELLGHERRLETLLEQLKELQADQHVLPEERYLSERARLEALAAETMRARDARRKQSTAKLSGADPELPGSSARPRKQGFGGRHPQWVGALWGAGVVGFFVALGFFLSRESKPRVDDEAMTGRKPPNEPVAAAAPDPGLTELLERVKRTPDNLSLLSEATHELIRAQRFDEAEQLVERGVGLDPFHPELRVHRAVLRATRGEMLQARTDLNRLADVYPSAHEALVFSGAIAMQTGDSAGALAAFQRFVAEAPVTEQPPQIHRAIEMLKQQAGGAGRAP